MHKILQTTAFRWAFGIAAWTTVLSLLLLGFVYWRTAVFASEQLDHLITHEMTFAASVPDKASERVVVWLDEDIHNVRFAGLFGADGRGLAGNLDTYPEALPANGLVHRIRVPVEIDGRAVTEDLHAAAVGLPDGRRLVVAHDLDEVQRSRGMIAQAIAMALAPMIALSIVGGVVLGARARRRLSKVEKVLARLMRGDLRQRLPVNGTGDEFDRLSSGVNALLAEIELLIDEVRGVGDNIAHDLRTPLTRLRVRLERSRDGARTVEELRDAVDQALVWLDQTLSIITAVLRISEIEHERRRAAFRSFDLVPMLQGVADLYEPAAEEKTIELVLNVPAESVPITGDSDLMFEAVANLMDNAVKFTPNSGTIRLGLSKQAGMPVITIDDSGPGIPAAERPHIFKRFYRSAPERHTDGNGLGLSIVAAIVGLHDFSITVGDAPGGGTRFELACGALQNQRLPGEATPQNPGLASEGRDERQVKGTGRPVILVK